VNGYAAATSGADGKTILLHALDSAAGVQATWGSPRQGRSEVNRERPFIVEGAGSLHLSVRSHAKAKGNQYFGLMIPLAASRANCSAPARGRSTSPIGTASPNRSR